MADIHYFNTDVAKEYGVNCAVILQNLWHWIKHNEANKKNFYDGNYWTYNSTKAFKELFPYLSQKQIETALKKLRDAEIIITGNYNDMKYDRTLWYAITEKGKCILLSKEMETTEKGNGFPADGEPIPNNKPVPKHQDNKPNKKTGKFDLIINEYTQDEITIDLLQEWLKVRDAKRAAMTERAIKINIDKLDKLAEASNMTVNEYLTEVIARGWAAFYEIKQWNNKSVKTYGATGVEVKKPKKDDLEGIL